MIPTNHAWPLTNTGNEASSSLFVFTHWSYPDQFPWLLVPAIHQSCSKRCASKPCIYTLSNNRFLSLPNVSIPRIWNAAALWPLISSSPLTISKVCAKSLPPRPYTEYKSSAFSRCSYPRFLRGPNQCKNTLNLFQSFRISYNTVSMPKWGRTNALNSGSWSFGLPDPKVPLCWYEAQYVVLVAFQNCRLSQKPPRSLDCCLFYQGLISRWTHVRSGIIFPSMSFWQY